MNHSRTRNDRATTARRLRVDCTTIARRLHGARRTDRAAIAPQLRGDRATIARRLHGDCTTIQGATRDR
eukprot:11005763-Lingulodinium_polyedra.AAC.1